MNSTFFILFCTVAANHAGFLQAPAELAYSSNYNTVSAPRAMIQTPVLNSIAYSSPIAKTISYVPAQLTLDTPAVGSSSQNVVRSFDGTVSQHAKAVDTAFSSVRKFDTRVNNNVYSPAIQTKTIGHANPAGALLTTYVAPAAKAVTYTGPVAHVSFNGFGTNYGW